MMPLDKTILKKKIGPVPVPVAALGAGVLGVIAYRRYAAKKAAADPNADQSAADYSQGTGTSGSAADTPSGVGDSGGTGGAVGGAFSGPPPTIILRQPIRNITKIIRRPRTGGPVRRRPLVVNRIIVNPRYPQRAPIRGTRRRPLPTPPRLKPPPKLLRPPKVGPVRAPGYR